MHTITENEIEQFGPRLVMLSAERTLLAWLRLCLALMVFGFVLDRFGLFIRLQEVQSAAWLPKAYTFWIGIGLVILGALTSVVAGMIYARFRLGYERKGYHGPKGGTVLGALLSMLITVIGMATAIFLVTIAD